MKLNRATVGILTYNTAEMVVRNVESLLNSGIPPEVLVVWDNASTDGTASALASKFPDVRSHESRENLGYAGGMNRLVEVLEGPRVILLTADCYTTRADIERLLKTLAAAEGAALCGARLLDARTGRVQSEGATLTYPLGISLPLHAFESSDAPRGPPSDVPYVGGAFLAIDTAAFRALGGFDERFIAYHEEADLCWRARLAGYRVVCDPRASAVHETYGSWGPFTPRRWRLTERNRILTNLKNLDGPHLGVALLAEVAYAAVLHAASMGIAPKGYLRAYGRALLDLLSRDYAIGEARRRVQGSRRLPDREVLKDHKRLGPRALYRDLNRIRKRFYGT